MREKVIKDHGKLTIAVRGVTKRLLTAILGILHLCGNFHSIEIHALTALAETIDRVDRSIIVMIGRVTFLLIADDLVKL